MSKKLPKENLKKVSGAAGISKGVVTNEALKSKNIAGGKNLRGQQIAGSDTITNLKGGQASNLKGNVLDE